jgi:hypothetical protein
MATWQMLVMTTWQMLTSRPRDTLTSYEVAFSEDNPPDLIESIAEAGFWVATKIHSWNREVVERRVDVHSFEHWWEFPALLPTSKRPLTIRGALSWLW